MQPENTPINSMSNSENDLSQLASESVPPITSDVDAYEMNKDGKRKLTSFVWNHFKRKTINGEEKVVCNYCNKALTVDHLGFKVYSEGLQSLFKVPSRNTVKSDIIKIYENENLKTMRLLDKIESKIALTSDIWTASNQKKGYMMITAHYVDDDWDM
ncbi:hypothetical protein KIW84_050734 [Lathyrus oleraceus]|uniref:BED-type domain-containing protein n=1 Tax=Pisum sativum TaxID=3888 RepID=A0A9D4WI76_PEA|nr:hypothetical protein KIW84_050734 [Pisum sativum]